MPKPIDGYVEPLRRSRRAAACAVELVAAGGLGREEEDLSDLLFGQVGPEAKLAVLGLLDDGGLSDEMVRLMAHRLKMIFDGSAPLKELTARFEALLPQVEAARGVAPPKGTDVGPTADPECNARNNRRVVSRAAGLLAVHLCQRAMHEAVNGVLCDLVSRQSAWSRAKGETLDKVHSPLMMEDKHVASADVAIERLRRPHMAGRRNRVPVSWEVLAALDGGVKPGAEPEGQPVDDLAEAMAVERQAAE